MTKEIEKQTSRFLCFILRHKPESVSVDIDEYGYVNTSELIAGMNRVNGTSLTLSDLVTIVEKDKKNSKDRYSFKDGTNFIKAKQGHSIPIKFDLPPLTGKDLPSWLYHGTNSKFVDIILKTGLNKMKRHHVHLSDNIETAKQVGDRRLKKDTNTKIFKISTIEMVNAGFEFFKTENNVYLIDFVPPKYLR